MSNWRAPFSARAILASAGSGKTFQLSNQYIGLMCRNVPVDRVLATTFTRKAAGEILDRVWRRLAEACESDKAAHALGEFIGESNLTSARCRTVLTGLVRSMPKVRIGTIDSFFARLATAFEMDLALPIGWAIADEETLRAISLEAVEKTIEQAEPVELVQLLRNLHRGGYPAQISPAILREVEASHAASLKTTVGAWSVAPCEPANRPMRESELARALLTLSEVPLVPTGGTMAPKSLVSAHLTILDLARTGQFLKLAGSTLARAARTPGGTFARQALSPELRAALLPIIAHAECVATLEIREANKAMRALADRYGHVLDTLKHQRGAFAFEDIPRLLLAANAVGNLPELYYRLDARIDHVLLDEFQDTSLEQFTLLRPLMEEILAGGEGQIERSEPTASAGRGVFLVGDVKQSMYAWRDAEPELFGEVLSMWPQLQREQLHQSRRSSPVVLNAVNAVFSTLSSNAAFATAEDRETATRWESEFVSHTSAHNLPGCVKLHVVPEAPGDDPPSTHRIRAAADQIRHFTQLAPWASIGVLLPARRHIARLIHELKERGVVASEEGGNPLTDSPAVAAVLSALQMVDHPADLAARYHVATTPLGEFLGLREWRHDACVCEVSSAIRKAISSRGFADLVRGWRQAIASKCTPRDTMRLARLVELALEYEALGQTRLRGFIELVESRRVESSAPERVRVMTIHKSKGLEFDAVVLPNLDVGMLRPDGLVMQRQGVLDPIRAVSRYPSEPARAICPELEHMYQQTRARNLRERLCVLYVAMTRARHAVDIFVDAKSKAKGLSYAQIVRSALGVPDDHVGAVLAYQDGDDTWTHARSKPASPSALSRPLHVGLQSASPLPTARLPTISPSSLRGSAPPAARSTVRATPLAHDVAAARLGTLLHLAFETIDWLDDGEVDPKPFVRGLDFSDAEEELATSDAVHRSLRFPEVRHAFARARYAEWNAEELRVWREVRIASRVQDSATTHEFLLAGVVDRLVIGMRGNRAIAAEVIDHKSDSLESHEVEARRCRYSPQVDAYRRVIAEQFGLDQLCVRGTLVFLGPGKVVTWP